MFFETSYNGLGDARSDCINSVRSRSATYAPAGSRIRLSGNLSASNSLLTQSNVTSALTRSGYQINGVNYSSQIPLARGTLEVSVTTPIDHGSINDVLSVVKGALNSAGFSFSGVASFLYRPSAEDVCAGLVSGGPIGSPTAPKNNAPPPPSEKSFLDQLFDSLKLPIVGLGGLTVGVVVGGVVVLGLLLKK